jgi:hypothetical protein
MAGDPLALHIEHLFTSIRGCFIPSQGTLRLGIDIFKNLWRKREEGKMTVRDPPYVVGMGAGAVLVIVVVGGHGC